MKGFEAYVADVGESAEEESVKYTTESKLRHTVRVNITEDNKNRDTSETLEENYSLEGVETDKEMIQMNGDLDLRIEQIIEKSDAVWKCKVCGKTFPNNSLTRRHAETHIEGIYHVCHICNKSLSTRNGLRTHISEVHSDLFSCDLCEKSGMNKKSYYKHNMSRQHKTSSVTLS